MTDAPIQIRNAEVVRAIRELAEQTGQPITQAVAQVVDAELRRRQAERQAASKRKLALMRDAVRRFKALPVIGPLLTDDDLYDQDGMPK